jgi:hypothetical protein
VPFIGAEGEGGDRTVRRWWWPSGAITPAILALNEGGGMMRGRGSGKGGIRFGEVRGLGLGREVAAVAC